MTAKKAQSSKGLKLPTYMYKKGRAFYYGPPVNNGPRRWTRIGYTWAEAIVEYERLVGVENSKGMMLSDMLDAYIMHHAKRISVVLSNPQAKLKPLKQTTFEEYVGCVNRLKMAFKQYPSNKVERKDVNAYLKNRVIDGLGVVRANREIAVLSAAYSWAINDANWCDLVTFNPCIGVPRHKESAREIYVSDEMFLDLLNEPSLSSSVKNVVRLMLLTSQRVGDLLAAKLSDVRTRRDGLQILRLTQSKTGVTVEIAVVDDLKLLIEERVACDYAQVDNILVNKSGREMSYENLQSQWQRFRKKKRSENSNIDFTLHDFRGKSATDAYESGRSLAEIQSMLGHRNASTTDKYLKRLSKRLSQPVRLPVDRRTT
jgi:integrase|nr:tyrosine-type recombinase/integrase [uncultured Limnohabitans sp.]